MRDYLIDMESKKFNLELEIELLKRQLKKKDEELKIAHDLINSYYQENKHDLSKYVMQHEKIHSELSRGAKDFVRDVAEGRI